MVALNVTKKAVANSNIGNPHFQPTAKGRITARRFSVVSSPWENGFVAEEKHGAGDGPVLSFPWAVSLQLPTLQRA
jgi:hypothetical protein